MTEKEMTMEQLEETVKHTDEQLDLMEWKMDNVEKQLVEPIDGQDVCIVNLLKSVSEVVKAMITSEDGWSAVRSFCEDVMSLSGQQGAPPIRGSWPLMRPVVGETRMYAQAIPVALLYDGEERELVARVYQQLKHESENDIERLTDV